MNGKGHAATLRHERGNLAAVKHGLYSTRVLQPRAEEIKRELLATRTAIGVLAAEEVATLLAMAEAADKDIVERGLTNRKGDVRTVVDLRVRISGRLERWAALVEQASRGGLSAEIRSRLGEGTA